MGNIFSNLISGLNDWISGEQKRQEEFETILKQYTQALIHDETELHEIELALDTNKEYYTELR